MLLLELLNRCSLWADRACEVCWHTPVLSSAAKEKSLVLSADKSDDCVCISWNYSIPLLTIMSLTVWSVAPSCRNHIPDMVSSTERTRFVIIVRYGAPVSVTALPLHLQKVRPEDPLWRNTTPHHTVHFTGCNGCSWMVCGFSVRRSLQFWLFPHPFRWIWTSSLIRLSMKFGRSLTNSCLRVANMRRCW